MQAYRCFYCESVTADEDQVVMNLVTGKLSCRECAAYNRKSA